MSIESIAMLGPINVHATPCFSSLLATEFIQANPLHAGDASESMPAADNEGQGEGLAAQVASPATGIWVPFHFILSSLVIGP